MGPRVTSRDVAELAHVSQATVSYIFSGNEKQSISQSTRDKVLKAAKQLNYFPTNAAKVLRSNRTNCVCVVINKNLMQIRYSQTLQGVRDVLENENYDIILCSEKKNDRTYVNYLNNYLEQRYDGIIYIGADGKSIDSSVLTFIKKKKIPFVALDCDIQDDMICSVEIDYAYGARIAAEYLLEKDYQKIVYLMPEKEIHQEIERYKGIQKAIAMYQDAQLITCKIDVDNLLLLNSDLNHFADADTLNQYLTSINERIAEVIKSTVLRYGKDFCVICSWSYMISGTIFALQKEHLKIPVVALAKDHLSAEYCQSGIEVFCSELPNIIAGRTCAQFLLNQLNSNNQITKVILRPTFDA